MEKDIGKIPKNEATDIIIRIDDFGGRPGLTIREYVNSSQTGYTGFTKSGTRIPADKFSEFKKLINSINEAELAAMPSTPPSPPDSSSSAPISTAPKKEAKTEKKKVNLAEMDDY
ncbi:MAG: hypothetical protein AABX65_01740 [Nanoarchaeota archaeon]